MRWRWLTQRALADGSLLPASADDFERLLIAQPNSSFLWVQYMAFHTQSAEVEAARSVASRALRTIDYHLEDVRLLPLLLKLLLLLFTDFIFLCFIFCFVAGEIQCVAGFVEFGVQIRRHDHARACIQARSR